MEERSWPGATGPEGKRVHRQAPRGADASPEQSKPASKARTAGDTGRAVLIVDDNEDLARGLARLLEIHGHQVQIAYDGPTGLEKAKEWHPEFVLLDIGLPVWTDIRSRPS